MFTTDISIPLQLPQIDQAVERIVGLSFELTGSLHYAIRQYGLGFNVSPVAVDEVLQYLLSVRIGTVALTSYSTADGVLLANPAGDVDTYINYSYDIESGAHPVSVLPGDDRATAFQAFYPGPQTLVFALDSNALSPFQGKFSNPQLRARVELMTTPVPEPATWAMMVLGFGLVGAGLRGGRTSIRFA